MKIKFLLYTLLFFTLFHSQPTESGLKSWKEKLPQNKYLVWGGISALTVSILTAIGFYYKKYKVEQEINAVLRQCQILKNKINEILNYINNVDSQIKDHPEAIKERFLND